MEAKKEKKMVRNVLGRGLSSLISTPPVSVVRSNANSAQHSPAKPSTNVSSSGVATKEEAANQSANGITHIAHSLLIPNPNQPRQEFKEEELKDLAESIRTRGILQPIIVRESKSDAAKMEIVAGERRWRAAKLAGLENVPVIRLELDDRQALEIAIIENVQREDLNPVEHAQAFQRLATEFSLTHEEIAERVGKDRASVSNYLRLLKLPEPILTMLNDGSLSMGHAKAILTVKEPQAQLSLANKAVKENLSVRALESIVGRVVVLDSGRAAGSSGKSGASSKVNPFPEIVSKLRNLLGTKVNIRHHGAAGGAGKSGSGRGRIEIEYFSELELDRVVETIMGKAEGPQNRGQNS